MSNIECCSSFQPLKNWRNFTRFCRFRNIFLEKKCLQRKVFLIREDTIFMI